MAKGVEVHGTAELARGSRRLAQNIEDQAHKEFGREAEQRASEVRASVPRRSGALAGSVVAHEATVGIGDGGLPYAGWIEFGGTRNRPYVPRGRYLFPIALAAQPDLVKTGTNVAKAEIRGFRWPTVST